MSKTIIEFKQVYFSYGDTPVLQDVNLSIERGEFISVIGPNGGGKTTLAKLILGLVHPDSGTVELFGDPPNAGRSRVGYVPQYTQFDPQFPISVLDVTIMGRMGRRFSLSGGRDRQAALAALDEVGMGDVAKRQFSSLSGGQRQRVLIARALASDPEVLLLDEPTSNVDMAVENRLTSLLESFTERMTILLVTHDLGFVSHLVTRLVCVNETARIHPTYEVTTDMIHSLYEGPIKMVRHDEIEGEH